MAAMSPTLVIWGLCPLCHPLLSPKLHFSVTETHPDALKTRSLIHVKKANVPVQVHVLSLLIVWVLEADTTLQERVERESSRDLPAKEQAGEHGGSPHPTSRDS